MSPRREPPIGRSVHYVLRPDEPVARADWERWYLPGSDGGAHPKALARLGSPPAATLDAVVGAMIRESDNAAADYLRDRLGDAALVQAAADAGWPELESVPPRGSPGPGDDDDGEVGYQGSVRLAGAASWTIRYGAAAVLDLPAAPVVEVLAALGHPVRLAVVRRLLLGPASAAELQEAAELTSTGQVYHHLRALVAARLVQQDARRYRVPPTAVVPVLVAVLAAADLGGAARGG